MLRKLILTALLLLPTSALAQSCLPTGPGGSPVTQVQASNTGTTGAVAATLNGAAGQTTYVCGFFITSGGATTGTARTATLTGTGATLNFVYVDPPLAAGQGVLSVVFGRCLASSATNTAMTLSLPGTGTGTVASAVTLWGCQQ